ncbi:MAG: hypothetical protein Q9221_002537 [Calogaya cf. arnoldii]
MRILSPHRCTATVKCSVQSTVSAVCTALGDLPPEESGAPTEAVDVTTTLSADEIQYTQIPITGGVAAAAASATGASATSTSGSPSTQQGSMTAPSTSSPTGPTPSQSSPSSGQANATGATGDAASLDRSSMIALVGAAALAAVLL